VVTKYLNSLGRESLYSQIRAAAASGQPVDAAALQDGMDVAMMEFGGCLLYFLLLCFFFVL
jgi:hypothetical protein